MVKTENCDRSCANCSFSIEKDNGKVVCNDEDGLYFGWVRRLTDKCPDFEEKKKSEKKL